MFPFSLSSLLIPNVPELQLEMIKLYDLDLILVEVTFSFQGYFSGLFLMKSEDEEIFVYNDCSLWLTNSPD